MALLKLQQKSLNPYDDARKMLSNNMFYSDALWEKTARKGELDMYINALSNTSKISDLAKFQNEYLYKYADDDTKLDALYTEVYADRNELKTFTRIMKDKEGKPVVRNNELVYEEYQATEYEHYKNAIREHNEINYQNILRQQEQERKDSLNWFAKVAHNMISVPLEMVNGALTTLDGISNIVAASGNALWTGLTKGGVDKQDLVNNMVGAFGDTMASDTWRLFKNLGVQDWIVDFESRLTDMRDLDGNYTGIGKVLGPICYSLGQMAPAMALGMGAGALGKATGLATNVYNTLSSATSSLVFYGAMTSNNVRDTYQQMALKGASVPTAAILLNASIKSALEYAVEYGMGKLFGATNIDNLVFGRAMHAGTAASLTKAGAKRLFSDFVQEGFEEVFQDTSSFLVDRAFSVVIDENFGEITELTWQSLMDTFVIGGLTSVAGSAAHILTAKNVKGVTPKRDRATGEIKRDENGDIIFKNINKLAAWEYGLDMQSFLKNVDILLKQGQDVMRTYNGKDSKDAKKYAAAFTEMYAAYRMISSLYSEIGEERITAAQKILTKVTDMINNGKFDNKTLSSAAVLAYTNLESLKEDQSKLLDEKLAKANMTEVSASINKDDIENDTLVSDIDDATRQQVVDILESDEKLKKVVLTKDGNNVVEFEDTLFVPLNYMKNANANIVYSTIAEERLVQNIVKGKYKGLPLKTILDTFKTASGNNNATIEEAVYNLIFNNSFFKIVLSTANKDVFKFVSSLKEMEQSIVPNNIRKGAYKQKINSVISNMKTSLYDYIINQQNADETYVADLFTIDEMTKIRAARWCKDLYNRVIDDSTFKKLTENDWTVLKNRVAGLSLGKSEKDILFKNLHSTSKSVRLSAMNRIAAVYKEIFTTKYDGKTFMPNTNIPNNVLNGFLETNALTIESLRDTNVHEGIKQAVIAKYGQLDANTIVKFWQDKFTSSCNNKYSFKFNAQDKLGVYEVATGKQVGFSAYNSQIPSMIEPKKLDDRTIIEKSGKQSSLIKKLLNPEIDAATASYLSIDDIINDPSLLHPQLQNVIEMDKRYGELSVENTFLFLREYILNTQKTTTIIVLADGSYSFASVSPMTSILKSSGVTINKNTRITQLVKPQYLYGRLATIKIRSTTNSKVTAEYNSTDNTIYINENVIKQGGNLLTFAFLHEFQHAVQVENSMNIGINSQWIKLNQIPKTTKQKIIDDVRKHRPELFKDAAKGSAEELKIVNDFVYYSSGEVEAYGSYTDKIVNFYPTIVRQNKQGTEIQFPWGTSYKLGPVTTFSLEVKNFADNLIELMDESHIDKLRKTPSNADLKRTLTLAGAYDASLILAHDKTLMTNFTDFIEQKAPAVREYIMSPIGGAPIPAEVKQAALTEVTPYKDMTLKTLYEHLRLGISYEEFLELPLPVIRLQSNDKIYDDVFVSFACCTDINNLWGTVNDYIRGEAAVSSSAYSLFYGFVKPKDMYAYIATSLEEALLPTDIAKNFKSVKISMLSNKARLLEGDLIQKKFGTIADERRGKVAAEQIASLVLELFDDLPFVTRNNTIFTEKNIKAIHTLEESYYLQKHQFDSYINKTKLQMYVEDNINTDYDTLEHEDVHIKALINSPYKTASTREFLDILKVNNISSDDDILVVCGDRSHEGKYVPGIIVLNNDDLLYASNNILNIYEFNKLFDSEMNTTPFGSIVKCKLKDISLVSIGMSTKCIIDYKTFKTLDPIGIYTSGADSKDYLLVNQEGEILTSSNKSMLGPATSMSMASNNEIAELKMLEGIGVKANELISKDKKITKEQLITALQADYPFMTTEELGDAISNYSNYKDKSFTKKSKVTKNKQKSDIVEDIVEDNTDDAAESVAEALDSLEHEDVVKPKEKTKKPRYAGQRKNAGTNLEKYGYIEKYKRTQMPEELQRFINNATEDIAPELWKKLTSGKLQVANVMDYFRRADTIDSVTFKLINDCFFQNSKITSFKELEEYVTIKTPQYYAARAVVRHLGYADKIVENANPKLLDTLLTAINGNVKLKKLYDDIYSRYYSNRDTQIIISEGNLRRLWMQYFDGSLYSGGYIAAIAKIGAINNWKITGEGASGKVRSLNEDIAEDMTLEDKLGDVQAEAEFDNIWYDLSRDKKIKLIMLHSGKKYMRKLIERGLSKSRAQDKLKEKTYELFTMSDAAFDKQYEKIIGRLSEEQKNELAAKLLIIETSGINADKLNDKQLDKLDEVTDNTFKNIVRTSQAVVDNIRGMTRTIKANLPDKNKALFLKENGDLFDDKLKIRDEIIHTMGGKNNSQIRLLDAEKLVIIEDRVRKLSEDVRAGVYKSKRALDYRKRADKRIAELELKNLKLLEQVADLKEKSTKAVVFNVSDDVLTINTDKEIPFALKRILETEFTKVGKSKIEYLLEADRPYIRTSWDTFIANNAEYLSALTQEDVNEIVDFYLTSEIIPSTNKARTYTATQVYMMGYLIKGSRLGNFTLTEEQLTALETRFDNMVGISAEILANWKRVRKELKPEEVIIQSLAAKTNIEFAASDVKELINAISTGDVAAIARAKAEMYKNGLKQYAGIKGRFLDKLLDFERMFMLSSPSTWIRNKVSNTVVEYGNKVAENLSGKIFAKLEQLFPNKKWHRENQYKIYGTKVPSEVQTFIQTNILSNGFLDLINDGLSRYDTRKTTNDTTDDDLTKLIIESIKTKIFQENSFANETVSKVHRFILKQLSDDKAIRKATIVYLGKMLTEDNIDLSKGLSTPVINCIAEAYRAAAYDYMHRSNFIQKLEQTARNNGLIGKVGYTIWKQVFPFASSSWNWCMAALRYTPIGLVNSILEFAKLETRIESFETARKRGENIPTSRLVEYFVKRNIGKGIIGTLGTIVGIILASLGFAGIDEEDDKYKLYVHIGDEIIYIDISDIFGTQGILAGIAAVSAIKDGNWKAAIADTLDTMFDDNIFSDIFNEFRYSTSLVTFAAYLPFDILSMFVPSVLKRFTKLTYGHSVQYSKGVVGKIEKFLVNSIPGMAYALPKVTDPYTGETQFKHKYWFVTQFANEFLPFNVHPYNVSNIEKKAISVGVKKQALTGQYKVNDEDVILTSKQTEKINSLYGMLNKKDLTKLMTSKEKYSVFDERTGKYVELTYNKMTDKQKKTVIERIMSNNSTIAKISILTSEHGYKYYCGEEEYSRLKKLGIKNIYKKTNKLNGFVKH